MYGEKKTILKSLNQNLLILLCNVESLNTHITDVDILLASYNPQIFILNGVGSAVRRKIAFPNYSTISQPGTSAFGGVMILCHKSIKYKIIKKDLIYILIEVESTPESIYIGAIYVPPQSIPPFQLLSKHLNKRFYIFANYNAKHTDWKCSKNNTSDVHLQNSLESTENELIIPSKATSKRSNAIIHFGITQDASGWISEVLDEGTSEHFPVLIQSSLTIDGTSTFRKANWKTFNFFLWLLNEYWLSVVYNLDEQTFFNLFSAFLSALWDRCSTNEKICDYRPPWPPHLVLLAKSTNRARRKYRRNRSLVSLQNYIILKEIFSTERSHYLHIKMEQKTKYMMHDQNIWKFAKPSFHCVTTPFRGLKYGNEKINDSEKIVEILANHYERHISESDFDMDNIAHTESIINYNQIKYAPNIPLDPISITKVTNEWNKFKAKKVIR
ncbi:unnamed protein product [Rotaria magnacalcarata]|uniref:Endonuclease/exonuclease/phosphatase domain-containing protein n=1 Tax=Rotaria magnacalcarata TaxID=392030 RepID=A0A816USA5_9BILA|nr:unnamed protein product [Rotaria magnacalcarata]CAF2117228.1 unnamed protein product [Rotaria magnacalcarata]CAF3989800.1 unnamed protein product [Rotaria magnacalcarata]CAF4099751.1 unnamed protein product [Rotaria magnacalcarata]